MNILLHTCCAPCSIMPIQKLSEAGHEITAYFYNPNIHPYREYKMRRNTFKDYMIRLGIPFVVEDDYDLEGFLTGAVAKMAASENRCGFCYEMRLLKAAEYAKNHGLDVFTSTLLVSIYQNHDLIRKTGEKTGKIKGVDFYYDDFRPYFREGQNQARELGLYMQSYCGCIYSEKERYWKAPKKA
ncbi:MAG: epoxyqueuosine reductase QueH [Clostridia bacterium]|nr:epoxyqueuosine reductase QueH [Clostridia bacterium]